MPAVLSTNNLTVPDDFPASQYDAVHTKLVAHGSKNEHRLFMGALHGISYRFKALADYDDSFTASINAHGTTSGQPIRYQQERDLFGFFSNAFSVFDSFCFALFAIGSLASPANFPLATPEDERNVNWGSLQRAYCRAFPANPILNALTTITTDTAFAELRDIRNILTHRAAPGRRYEIEVSSSVTLTGTTISRLNIPLDAATTSSRRRHVAKLLHPGFDATQKFVEDHL